ncbi:type I-C CRISPR-associated endonuclease Cas1c [Prosthecochloris sp. HL-130-GSB]|uniref:type I-C CRISPR-associated endonuclease Cas1c n=1 Tax=Prosthecochloris sp. HL-130-GSB TaxID=1974213 RepID=UPI000A1C08E5|nr:type I-C CRISPR-associated endonuclease Cas1c [Prosthecochloris sp. HL-130-GSB]ARM31059.1 subtype I-C CRISPR-associated endonuclease Cas1 [Prosthecochloris sp. HL-130-GSB]
MKKLQNTLYVSTQGAYLSKDGECVLVKIDGEEKSRIPIHILDSIVCFGQISVSPYLMGFCAEKGVAVTFLSQYGKFLCSVQGPVRGNILLRRAQYRMADDPAVSGVLARSFVIGKIANARVTISRIVRDHVHKVDVDRLKTAQQLLAGAVKHLRDETDPDRIRGIEGDAAKIYFSVFDQGIISGDSAFGFNGRNRRPPLDRVNCLLSFFYTLLTHDIRSALESVGLDPAAGFLHRDRPGRPSLALDMLEEFRSYVADRLTLTLINRGQVKPGDFEIAESGAVLLKDDARKEILVAYQNRKSEEIMHPFLAEKMPVGLLWHMQALLLARYIRGDIEAYPPFVWS